MSGRSLFGILRLYINDAGGMGFDALSWHERSSMVVFWAMTNSSSTLSFYVCFFDLDVVQMCKHQRQCKTFGILTEDLYFTEDLKIESPRSARIYAKRLKNTFD
ncbi:hypothetical protein E4U13_001516 [Claviceps humidiphila]|uniref:Uncharacterized protein n=1 Tax=Claviceps humidiphila TaxID=1294629 RepID=A0A9P7TXX7_9HYPO|nr:hypothetical protein E4U13_001516 [Claviceps humidiphila]